MANIIADHYRKDRNRIRNHPFWLVSMRIRISIHPYFAETYKNDQLWIRNLTYCKQCFWIPTKRTLSVSATILYGKYHCGSLQKGPYPYPQPSFMANIIADLYKKDRIRIPNHPLWQISLRIPTKRTISVSATLLSGASGQKWSDGLTNDHAMF